MIRFILLFLLPSVLFGISLEEAEELALKNFYLLREKEKEVRAARLGYLSALSELLPQVKLSLSYHLARRQELVLKGLPLPGSFTLLESEFYRINLLLEQELINPVKFRKVKLSRRLISLKEKELLAARNKVLWEVRRAYINALKLEALLKVYQKQRERVAGHLRNVKELYREGVVPFKDILETRVKLYEVESRIKDIKVKYENALDYLSYLTGSAVKDLEEDLELPVVKEGISGNPELRALRDLVNIAEEREKLVALSFLPTLNFSLLVQRTTETRYLPENRYLVSVSLNWLLLGGGKRVFELQKARREKEKILLTYRRKEEELKLRYRALRRELEAIEEEIRVARERLKEARENYRLAREKYENGLGINTEVLDAEAYLTAAEENLRIKEYERILKLYEIMEVAGE
ncbi:MAG: TolC family protein [Aquificae bacterium]|nr:TolC family protein [Aquificota bacterium]